MNNLKGRYFNSNWENALTVKQLKQILNNIGVENEDAIVIFNSSLIHRDMPMLADKIDLTTVGNLELYDDEHKDDNVQVLYVDADKFTFYDLPGKNIPDLPDE